jgi:hypothetical protein
MKVAGGRSVAKTSGKPYVIEGTLEGCQRDGSEEVFLIIGYSRFSQQIPQLICE